MDQMKKAKEKTKDSMRKASHVDDLIHNLIHRTNSPFITSITSLPLPFKFKMPTLDSYDGIGTLVITLLHSRQPCTSKVF